LPFPHLPALGSVRSAANPPRSVSDLLRAAPKFGGGHPGPSQPAPARKMVSKHGVYHDILGISGAIFWETDDKHDKLINHPVWVFSQNIRTISHGNSRNFVPTDSAPVLSEKHK